MMINFKLFIIIFLALLMISCASTIQHSYLRTPKIDRISAEELNSILTKSITPLSLNDVVRLTKEGVSTDQIIEKIRISNSVYHLTPSQVVDLNRQGLDTKVLDYISMNYELAIRNNVAEEINQREKIKRAELDKLKHQLWLQQQQRIYDPACGYGYHVQPNCYGAFESRLGDYSKFGFGYGLPLGCW